MSAIPSFNCPYTLRTIPNSLRSRNACCRRRRRVFACTSLPSTPNPEPENVPLLEMRNITYRIPNNRVVKVFDNMNFRVYPKEFVMVIGHNGAGKTTALHIMSGLQKIPRNDGEIFWKGTKMRGSKLLRNIGMVMQHPADYFICPTVLDEIIAGRPTKTPDDVRRILTAVGLSNISLMARPSELSGGQIRRLAIASQLAKDPLPELFILDEPMAGVDWTARHDVAKLLQTLKSQFAVIIVSHEPGDLLKYADRVVEVGRGGMQDIDPKIVKKAIKIREQTKVEVRMKARQAAAEYANRQKQ